MTEPPPPHRQSGLTVLWRGPLSGCNYDCSYCPFAKRVDSRETLAEDRAALEAFTDWATTRDWPVTILFTPWGEALIRRYYQEAMVRLSHAPNVQSVAIQTNLSCSIDWIQQCDRSSAAFWATYHPGQTDRAAFLQKVEALHAQGTRISIGSVALREHFEHIEALRKDLPKDVYLWINAEESLKGTYTPEEISRLVAIDPLFELNNTAFNSFGRACHAGETVISVRGDGSARRCHFIDTPIGNIYDDDFEASLFARPCSRNICDCHIGYSHLKALDFGGLFQDGLIERRATHPARAEADARLRAFVANSD